MKKLLIASFALNLILASVLVWFKVGSGNQDEKGASYFKPENLKDGQCVIQVNGEKGNLFNQMQARCRVLVVLDSEGKIQEILEK